VYPRKRSQNAASWSASAQSTVIPTWRGVMRRPPISAQARGSSPASHEDFDRPRSPGPRRLSEELSSLSAESPARRDARVRRLFGRSTFCRTKCTTRATWKCSSCRQGRWSRVVTRGCHGGCSELSPFRSLARAHARRAPRERRSVTECGTVHTGASAFAARVESCVAVRRTDLQRREP
jgi:hypothetical protein